MFLKRMGLFFRTACAKPHVVCLAGRRRKVTARGKLAGVTNDKESVLL